MCAIPVATFFLTFFFCGLPFAGGAPDGVLVFAVDMIGSRYFPTYSGRRLARAREDALTGSLARTRVRVRALPVDREALTVTETAVATEVHQALDVHLHLTAQVAFDLVFGL